MRPERLEYPEFIIRNFDIQKNGANLTYIALQVKAAIYGEHNLLFDVQIMEKAYCIIYTQPGFSRRFSSPYS